MAFTKITTLNLDSTINTKLAAGESANASIISLTASLAPKIASVNVTSNTFSTLDDAAVNTGGGYIVLTGENFAVGATVLIDATTASAVTRVNSTQLQVQVPAKAAATYNLFVVNPDGGTGIRVNGLTYSSEPFWTTASPLANVAAGEFFGVNFSANDATSYAVAAGSTLPAGTTLAANGYFSGTVSIESQTTYSFSIVATDVENQDASKTFQVTVTVAPRKKLYAWGYGYNGLLGQNDTVDKSSPTQVGSATNWSTISTHYNSNLGIKTDGTLWAWGDGVDGILGLDNQVSRSSPTQVGSATNWSSVNVARFSTAAIKTDGTLWTWGQNFYGNLGTNDRVARSSPTQIGSGTDWSQVKHSDQWGGLALKTNGTLWTWGNGFYGGTGQNDTVNRSSPVQIGSNTNWSKIAASGRTQSAAAIKTDGTLWLWGQNNLGQLGLDNVVNRSSPTQVGSGTDWNLVSFGYKNCAAIKTNGTLWVWGENFLGSLGLDNEVNKSSPTQLGSGSTWNQVDLNASFSAAIKSNGTLWTWGQNNTGQLGHLPLYTYRSSPIQVGAATTWTEITVGSLHMLAITTD